MHGLVNFNQILWVSSSVIWSGRWSPVTFSRSGAKYEWRVVWRVIEFVRISVWRRAIESRADKLPVEGMERKEGGTWRGEGGVKS